jgi:TonB-linked SusC/RagA family outer membrane protein
MKQAIKTAMVCAFLLLLAGSVDALAQSIKGKVTDEKGHALPGVTVYFKGTTNGVVTDEKGAYAITKRGGSDVLVFSCVGLKEQEQVVTNRVIINVTMQEAMNFLDEAVSIGYQEVKRKDLLGSVVSVDNKAITSLPATNFAEALAGKMAGVNVTTAEGDPGASVSIKVRGTASITQDGSPLYIVDGFPVNSIADLSPQDIKSVDVLKDAFSTAIYGSRGAYGVVLITTKEAARGKVSLSYDGYYGVKMFANKDAVQVLSPYEFAQFNYEYAMAFYRGDRNKAQYKYNQYFGEFEDMALYKDAPANDWVGKVFDNLGYTQNHSVQLSGSADRVRWNASYSHMEEQAIMLNSNYKRDNLSFRAFFTPLPKLSFSFGTRYSNTLVQGAGANSVNDKGTNYSNGRLLSALRYTPIPFRYHEEDLGDVDVNSYFGTNPIQDVEDNDNRTSRENWNINGSATWTIIPNLKLKVEGGMDANTSIGDRFYGLTSYYTRFGAVIPNQPNSIHTDQKDRTVRSVNTLSYNFKNLFRDNRHVADVLLGQEYSFSTGNSETVTAQGFPTSFTSEMTRLYRGSAAQITSSTNTFSENNVLLSFFGRANYVFDNRYSLSAALRADASSKFAPQNRWGVFPSVAASWTISNESFMRGLFNVDQLKLRYSFGTAGNNRIPSGNIRTTFFSQQNNRVYEMPNMIIPGEVMPNPDLRWEITYSHNIGLDYALFHSRLSGSIELYNNTTKDLLINFPTSGTGYNTQYRNLGSVRNRGIEFSTRFIVVEKRNFGLNVSGNIAFNQNRVISLGGVDKIETNSGYAYGLYADYIVTEGEPLGMMYGLQSDGFYTTEGFTPRMQGNQLFWDPDPEMLNPEGVANSRWFAPGAPRFIDQNGDNKINADDRVKLGSTLPIGTGGFSLNGNLYGVDFSASFNFCFGNKIYNANSVLLTQRGQYEYRNLSKDAAPGNGHAWTNIDWNTGELISDPELLAEVNKDATTWSPYTVQNFFSDQYIEDGSFLRLGSLSIGYTLPESFTQRFHVQKLRIYVSGSNLFCLTRYSGYDPEVNCRRSTPLTPGVDCSAYPKSRSYIVGVNITL